ncbi:MULTISPECIES: hypothetical protein [Chryseobacterium]|jgi:hypothetical protein|uniref:Lipoprotein n=1 Tax=Chryseobacterium aquaticum subsp. greenlandense TaxID=345663 RepID=A0A101CFL2_9FLAO|nr:MULTISPECIES: hypothetical protein [Chryseobacterium]KUJ55347.1 hypothetical protein AR686_13300 [Chryseobacterium aquaticum subsp. greenlandense]MDV2445865.1 hypothetical protein [Elizabethkingia anophelis]|tara:strand:- start:321 stop:695 length:375 start_codon:yes stop_codon:yes gene_type:complete
MRKTVIFLLIAFAIQSCQNNKPGIATVEDVLDNPMEFLSQENTIQGVVSQSNSDKQQFSIIGQKEFDKCGIDKCNANEQLPIRFKDSLPKVGDKVEVSGQITKTEEGFIYEAKSIRDIKDISDK